MDTIELPPLRGWLQENCGLSPDADASDVRATAQRAVRDGTLTKSILNTLRGESTEGTEHMAETANPTNEPATKLFGGARVKDASERYSTTKSAVTNPRTGAEVLFQGAPASRPSQAEYAMLGAWYKYNLATSKIADCGVPLTDHDRQLYDELVHKKEWCADIADRQFSGLTGTRVKAILEDSTSGGSYALPQYLDQQLAIAPQLYGEIAPFVNNIELPTSNAVLGASVGIPTFVWNQAEGTAITLFDTTSLIGQVNCNVRPVMGSYEIGRDMLADTPIALGEALTTVLAAALAAQIDKIIVVGDGTNQPQGLSNASGLTVVNSCNGPSGPITVADMEQLMFSVPKQYRQSEQWRPAYISSDWMYGRVRSIPQGDNDARRVWGMDHGSYTLLSQPYRVQNNIQDGLLFYGALAAYKLYRRSGADFRWTDQGQTLQTKNTVLLTVRARYAGKLSIANAFAVCSDAAVGGN